MAQSDIYDLTGYNITSAGMKEVNITKFKGLTVNSVTWQRISGCSHSVIGNKLRFTISSSCNYYKFKAIVNSACGPYEELYTFVYSSSGGAGGWRTQIESTGELLSGKKELTIGSTINSRLVPLGSATPMNKALTGIDEIKVFPNPFNQNLNIAVNSLRETSAMIQIFDITGKNIYQETRKIYKGKNLLKINIYKKIPDGIYQLHLVDSDGNRSVRKIVSSTN